MRIYIGFNFTAIFRSCSNYKSFEISKPPLRTSYTHTVFVLPDIAIHFVSILCCLGALIALFFLTITDLKVRLLPNTYVLSFALFGLAFHAATNFYFSSFETMVGGIVVGGGLLYIVRVFANRAYKQDALGLGDIKLMMAGGIWLGSQDILSAIIIGSCAGIIHGLCMALMQKMKTGEPINLSRFTLPAGPGFIVGLLAIGLYKFYPLPSIIFS